jgi:hypothetical protein
MPMAATEKSMRLFANEVMPALKELKPEPLGETRRVVKSSISQHHAAR